MTKPVFGVSDKVRFKPACSATEISYKIEISVVASLDMIHSKKQITKALISLCGCAGWSAPLLFANLRRQVISRCGPYNMNIAILQCVAVSARIEGRFTLESYMHVLQLASSSKLHKASNDHWSGQYFTSLSTIFQSCSSVSWVEPVLSRI